MADSTQITAAAVLAAIWGAIFVVYRWVGKHISDTERHPSKDNLVYLDVCNERGKANDTEHNHLKEGIQQAINRSDEQHQELKKDMKEGFTEIKTLIKSGH